jgi:hypothetical protein
MSSAGTQQLVVRDDAPEVLQSLSYVDRMKLLSLRLQPRPPSARGGSRPPSASQCLAALGQGRRGASADRVLAIQQQQQQQHESGSGAEQHQANQSQRSAAAVVVIEDDGVQAAIEQQKRSTLSAFRLSQVSRDNDYCRNVLNPLPGFERFSSKRIM